ncbi:MAG: hypothetical protein WCT45_01735 [Candidatus Paceibacterota bacterium]
MRSRTPLIVLLVAFSALVLPQLTHAAIPFLGPIIPKEYATCAAGWGMVMLVVNNIISFAITVIIVFVAPLMFAYAGFLFVFNPISAGGKTQARHVLTNLVVGLVVALAAWMIVDAIMAVLYDSKNAGGVWSSLITSGGADICLPIAVSLKQAGGAGAPSGLAVACSVPALSPITDPLAQQMEGGQTVIWDNTDPRLHTCVNKFVRALNLNGNTGTVTSAYRPQSYQTHLYEIRDRWCTQGLQSNSDAVCSTLKSSVSAEVAKHFGSAWNCGAVAQSASTHSSGKGVDISVSGGNANIATTQAASAACLTWNNYPGDSWHYTLKDGCTCQ